MFTLTVFFFCNLGNIRHQDVKLRHKRIRLHKILNSIHITLILHEYHN